MFQNTLLIIKPDYIPKRKPVLLKVLESDFHILGSRKLHFTPEDAAEFYKDSENDPEFMLKVILLSRASCHSEAFILARENAVEELMQTMICYFNSSKEMERNLHVTKNKDSVQREISFIFPNYVDEPIPCMANHKFCQKPVMEPLMAEIFDIYQGLDPRNPNWRTQLAEWLTLSNKDLPRVSNQCSAMAAIRYEDKGQQTRLLEQDHSIKIEQAFSERSASQPSYTSAGSSAIMSSSSCITCSCFDDTDACIVPPPKIEPCVDVLEALDAPIEKVQSSDEEICEVSIEWVVEEESYSDHKHDHYCGASVDDGLIMDQELGIFVENEDAEADEIKWTVEVQPEVESLKVAELEQITEPEQVAEPEPEVAEPVAAIVDPEDVPAETVAGAAIAE